MDEILYDTILDEMGMLQDIYLLREFKSAKDYERHRQLYRKKIAQVYAKYNVTEDEFEHEMENHIGATT